MVLIECGCAGSSESVWHCALADSPLQGLPKARSNPTTQSAPVVWEGGLLLLALGTMTGETLRSQFHSAHFFETSVDPSAGIRLPALPELDHTVWFHAVYSYFWL